LAVARSNCYYQPATESEENLKIMKVIDQIHLEEPTYGRPRITQLLRRQGHAVNEKRVGRLMKLVGIEAIYPKPKTTAIDSEHRIFPYLLRDRTITRPDEVWSADITYIPMARGFMYLVAVMDWFSRYVLSWSISNTLEVHFCVEALESAMHNAVQAAEIFNTDQGSQFTSSSFVSAIQMHGMLVSMDGKGRWVDNVLIERLWRSYKYEDVYLKSYADGYELQEGAEQWFGKYNRDRPHQSLGWRTPREVYLDRGANPSPAADSTGAGASVWPTACTTTPAPVESVYLLS
jgi:putative transposase